MNGTLHEDRYTFSIIPRSVLVRMKNISDKVIEKLETHTLYTIIFFFFYNRAACEIMWKNTVERGRAQMTIWRMRVACWILKATNTYTGYVIHIAFPLQQWLQESASMLRYT